MGMSIEDAINHIKYGIIENNYPLQRDLGIEACNLAIETMRKYQKIEEIVNSKTTRLSYEDGFRQIKEVVEDGNDD